MICNSNKIITIIGFILVVGASSVYAFEPKSGYEFLTEETRAMQDDDFENPGMVTVDEGARLFQEQRPDEEYACSSCHGLNGEKLDTKLIASYPVFDPSMGGLLTLQERVNHCWEISMDRFPLDYDHPDLIALETYVRNRAVGEPIHIDTNGPLKKLLKKGGELYQTRFGQINMSCHHCHDQHQGQMLRGQKLSQGQANGFPEYRLGKGRITSLHMRMRECFISFRAEPFDAGSEEFRLIELYLMSRGNGLKIETPAVRF